MDNQIAPNSPTPREQPPSQRVPNSDRCDIHLCQILQKSQLHAQPPDNFTLSFFTLVLHIVSRSPRPPPIAFFVSSWDESVANFHLKRGGSTAKRLSTHTPRLDFLHELPGAKFWSAVRHSRPTQLSVTVRETAGIAYDSRSKIFVGIWKLEGDIGDISGKDDTTRYHLA